MFRFDRVRARGGRLRIGSIRSRARARARRFDCFDHRCPSARVSFRQYGHTTASRAIQDLQNLHRSLGVHSLEPPREADPLAVHPATRTAAYTQNTVAHAFAHAAKNLPYSNRTPLTTKTNSSNPRRLEPSVSAIVGATNASMNASNASPAHRAAMTPIAIGPAFPNVSAKNRLHSSRNASAPCVASVSPSFIDSNRSRASPAKSPPTSPSRQYIHPSSPHRARARLTAFLARRAPRRDAPSPAPSSSPVDRAISTPCDDWTSRGRRVPAGGLFHRSRLTVRFVNHHVPPHSPPAIAISDFGCYRQNATARASPARDDPR